MRRSGILLHPTSLPGSGPCGDLGEGAYRFLDWLASAGCTLWQTLPLNPPGGGFSPYGSPGSFAGATHLISVDRLVVDGLLRAEELGERPHGGERVDLRGLERWHQPLISQAARRLADDAPEDLERFAQDNPWAADWALFAALRAAAGVDGWWQFSEALQARDADALARARDEHHAAIQQELALQLIFRQQWADVRRAARDRGIAIIGDVPIFVAGDGCDTWCHRALFRGTTAPWRPDPIAGAPPDDFSPIGQRWGNPLYDWPAHERDGFAWWVDRFRAVSALVDTARVDHFRGFCAAWEIPVHAADAREGRWIASPGPALFAAVRRALGRVPIIAEDLGVITPDVEQLRDDLQVPGMKVLVFAFGKDAHHSYLPHNFPHPRWVAYTSTHDTDTARGWYDHAPEAARHRLRVYVGRDGSEPSWDLIRLAWSSTARWSIAPMQDVLALGSGARMNTPGTAQGNWRWRTTDLPADAAHRLAELAWVYGRRPRTS